MWNYIIRRLGLGIFVVCGATVVTFVSARLLPGDPAARYAGPRPTPEQVETARARLGLNQSLIVQLARFVGELLNGNFGSSFKTRRPIVDDLRAYFPPTAELVAVAGMIALCGGVALGAAAGSNPFGWADRLSRLIAMCVLSLPVYWLSLLAQQLFSGVLALLPLAGRLSTEVMLSYPIETITGLHLIDAAIAGNWPAWWDALMHLVLPAAVLAAYPFGVIFRMCRASVMDAYAEPFVMAARARGASDARVLVSHVLPTALPVALNAFGMFLAYAFTGAVFIESAFSWPGLGRYMTEAVLTSDYPVIVVLTLLTSIGYAMINLATDIAHIFLDARLRRS